MFERSRIVTEVLYRVPYKSLAFFSLTCVIEVLLESSRY